jgi:hypothetical protein
MEKLRLPDLPLTGGCQCGAVRYAIGAAPATFYLCHCTDCQRQSGSGFGTSLQIRTDSLEVTGATAEFARTAGSGRQMRCTFCPACGTRLWHARAEATGFASLKSGTLDDPTWLRPAAEIFTARRLPWVRTGPAPLQFPGQPDMARMRAAFAGMLD